MQVAYLGFIQQGNVRRFQFDGHQERQPGIVGIHVKLVMNADMVVMSRHHLRFQDLPGLCLRKLSALFAKYERYEGQGTEYTFSEADVCSYLAALASQPAKKERARFHRPIPAPSSQLYWPPKDLNRTAKHP
jgi:hypothetical protein